jgi:hypothetical protein
MGRLEGVCGGDCARCELLASGQVDMIPCILDQIFRRVQRLESEIESSKKVTLVAGVEPKKNTRSSNSKQIQDVQEDDGAGA